MSFSPDAIRLPHIHGSDDEYDANEWHNLVHTRVTRRIGASALLEDFDSAIEPPSSNGNATLVARNKNSGMTSAFADTVGANEKRKRSVVNVAQGNVTLEEVENAPARSACKSKRRYTGECDAQNDSLLERFARRRPALYRILGYVCALLVLAALIVGIVYLKSNAAHRPHEDAQDVENALDSTWIYEHTHVLVVKRGDVDELLLSDANLTLRGAIHRANEMFVSDESVRVRIEFDISDDTEYRILVASALPAIRAPVRIDGAVSRSGGARILLDATTFTSHCLDEIFYKTTPTQSVYELSVMYVAEGAHNVSIRNLRFTSVPAHANPHDVCSDAVTANKASVPPRGACNALLVTNSARIDVRNVAIYKFAGNGIFMSSPAHTSISIRDTAIVKCRRGLLLNNANGHTKVHIVRVHVQGSDVRRRVQKYDGDDERECLHALSEQGMVVMDDTVNFFSSTSTHGRVMATENIDIQVYKSRFEHLAGAENAESGAVANLVHCMPAHVRVRIYASHFEYAAPGVTLLNVFAVYSKCSVQDAAWYLHAANSLQEFSVQRNTFVHYTTPTTTASPAYALMINLDAALNASMPFTRALVAHNRFETSSDHTATNNNGATAIGLIDESALTASLLPFHRHHQHAAPPLTHVNESRLVYANRVYNFATCINHTVLGNANNIRNSVVPATAIVENACIDTITGINEHIGSQHYTSNHDFYETGALLVTSRNLFKYAADPLLIRRNTASTASFYVVMENATFSSGLYNASGYLRAPVPSSKVAVEFYTSLDSENDTQRYIGTVYMHTNSNGEGKFRYECGPEAVERCAVSTLGRASSKETMYTRALALVHDESPQKTTVPVCVEAAPLGALSMKEKYLVQCLHDFSQVPWCDGGSLPVCARLHNGSVVPQCSETLDTNNNTDEHALEGTLTRHWSPSSHVRCIVGTSAYSNAVHTHLARDRVSARLITGLLIVLVIFVFFLLLCTCTRWYAKTLAAKQCQSRRRQARV